MKLNKLSLKIFLLLIIFQSTEVLAQTNPGIDPDFLKASLLKDTNGDGIISIAAFGDSITRGTGDFNPVGEELFQVETPLTEAGYPLRIERLTGIGVSNFGNPGERLDVDGLFRFADLIPNLRAEYVIISEGANDAREPKPNHDIFYSLQTMINIAYAYGTMPILATIPPPCCNHGFLREYTDQYSDIMRSLSTINTLALADLLRAFDNTCNRNECSLLNLPEGLHPNIAGYDVIGETIIATLLNIDIFTNDGPSQLETALRLPIGSVKVKPDPVPVTGQSTQ